MTKPRIEIRNMFISSFPTKSRAAGSVYDVAILTPSDGYIEYELKFIYDRMTHTAYETIKSLMSDYRLTPETEICATDNISEKNPLLMYLAILAQQIGFMIHSVPLKKMSDRLCGIVGKLKAGLTYDKDLSKTHMEAIWRYLIGSKTCSWITPEYDEYVRTLSDSRRRRKKTVRIGAYYMRRRRLKYQYTVRSKLRAAQASSAAGDGIR